MASNTSLIAVKGRGGLNGFGNLLRKENHRWWGTRTWFIQTLIWTLLFSAMMAQEATYIKSGEAFVLPPFQTFFMMAAIGTAIGVVILGQDALIDERKLGTAAWVFTKPVSRTAFMLSKLGAYAVGFLMTMVVLPGTVAYFLFKLITGYSLPLPGYLAALGLLYLLQLYFLTLTFMLGSLFHSRGPVIGIPLALVFSLNIASTVVMSYILPWGFMTSVAGNPPMATALVQGQPIWSITPIITIAFLVVLFTVIALVRFQREEF